MLNQNKEFFEIVDNFANTKNIESICIVESKLDFLPKVTIAIPTFHRVGFLKEAIDSALNQINYYFFEVIVVDNNPERDCETEKLLKSYKNPRLSYYKNKENLLMSGNWNRAFQIAKGEYLLLLHDDDLILPSFLSDSMKIIDTNKKIGILKPLAYSLKSDIIDIEKLNNNTIVSSDKIQRLYDFSNIFNFKLGAPTGVLFNVKDVIELGGYNQNFFPVMDLCFAVNFSQKKEVYLYHKYLSIYRISDNESLKLSCLVPSFEYTYLITNTILEKYQIPHIIKKWFLSCKSFLSIKSHESYNNEFKYNIESLGLKIPNKLDILMFRFTFRVVNSVMDFFTTKHA